MLAALLASQAFAAKDPVGTEAATEVASQFLDMIKQLLGGGQANDDAKTVAELAEAAPSNMSLLVDGVERAGLHTRIADPNFEATVFAPTNWVSPFLESHIRCQIHPACIYVCTTISRNSPKWAHTSRHAKVCRDCACLRTTSVLPGVRPRKR